MIKVTKPTTVPKSLNGKVTTKRRNEIINAGFYPTKTTIQSNSNFTSKDVATYDSRYKTDDIKQKLNEIYNCKCAYCETKVEQYHIEHYRPKSLYYWLVYSWDNLLLCCPFCNENKSASFAAANQADINSISINDIHNLRDTYDSLENPEMINPEKTDISSLLKFNKEGIICSTDKNVSSLIGICKLERDWLNKRRKELYDDFEKKILARKYEFQNGDNEAPIKLKGFIEDFITDSQNEIKEYLAFRKFIIKNMLNSLI